MKTMTLSTFFILAFISLTTATTPTNSTILALGQACNPTSPQCTPGVSCYAVDSMEIPTCGSFQGKCKSTAQCATNECVNGFCAGTPLLSLGAQCITDETGLPCAFGASCYAVKFMEETICGNLGAECSWDGQCAFNHCVDGFCSGSLLSVSSSSTLTTLYSIPPTSTPSHSPYYSANATTSYLPAKGTGASQSVGPSTSVLYRNGTATVSNMQVTSTVVVGGKTSAAGDTSFRQGPSQTASVQSGGVGKVASGAWALGIVGVVMCLL